MILELKYCLSNLGLDNLDIVFFCIGLIFLIIAVIVLFKFRCNSWLILFL